jgi:hypothetical protein
MSRRTNRQYEIEKKLNELKVLHCGFTDHFERQTLPKGLIIKHDFAVGHDTLKVLMDNFNVTLMRDGRLFVE